MVEEVFSAQSGVDTETACLLKDGSQIFSGQKGQGSFQGMCGHALANSASVAHV